MAREKSRPAFHPHDARVRDDDARSQRMREIDLQIERWREQILQLQHDRPGSGDTDAVGKLQNQIYRAEDKKNRLYVKKTGRV